MKQALLVVGTAAATALVLGCARMLITTASPHDELDMHMVAVHARMDTMMQALESIPKQRVASDAPCSDLTARIATWKRKSGQYCSGHWGPDWDARTIKSLSDCQDSCTATENCTAITVGTYVSVRDNCVLCTSDEFSSQSWPTTYSLIVGGVEAPAQELKVAAVAAPPQDIDDLEEYLMSHMLEDIDRNFGANTTNRSSGQLAWQHAFDGVLQSKGDVRVAFFGASTGSIKFTDDWVMRLMRTTKTSPLRWHGVGVEPAPRCFEELTKVIAPFPNFVGENGAVSDLCAAPHVPFHAPSPLFFKEQSNAAQHQLYQLGALNETDFKDMFWSSFH